MVEVGWREDVEERMSGHLEDTMYPENRRVKSAYALHTRMQRTDIAGVVAIISIGGRAAMDGWLAGYVVPGFGNCTASLQ